MVTLSSGLKLIDLGTEGWDAIFNYDMELLDEKLESVMTAAKAFGDGTVADNTGTMTTPSAQTSLSLTDNTGGTANQIIQDVGPSYNRVTLNNNFASVTDEVNALIADVGNIVPLLTEIKTYLDGLQTTVNDLLEELRFSTGCGVLGG